MISIYNPGNEDFDKNGNAVLEPVLCDLEMNIGGSWELTIETALDDKALLIVENAVIKCDTCVGKNQLFRIYDKEKTYSGVTAKARPIFFDCANDAYLIDTRPTDKTGQQALDIITSGTKYSGSSNIDKLSTAYFIRKNLLEAINGTDENSFVNRWGGEPIYNNYHITMNKSCGADRGARAEFGYNLSSITEKVNMDAVITRIIPESYNGYTLEGSQPWVDSPNIDKFPKVFTKVVQYSDVKLKEDCSGEEEDGFETIEELRSELIARAKKDFDDGCDLPAITYAIEMVDLENTIEYENIKDVVKVRLGDTVHCKNKRLDITTKARAVKIVWDCILQRSKSMEIGDASTNYFNNMTSVLQRADAVINDNGTLKGEYVTGIIDGMTARVRASTFDAKKQADKAILFEDRDPSSETYGAMALGTTGFCIAGELEDNGKDWKWSTFGTGAGFFADFIVAGTMLADRIKGGVLELGGFDNKSGVLNVLDSEGNCVGIWDNTGITSKSKTHSGYSSKMNDGGYIIRFDKTTIGELGIATDAGSDAKGFSLSASGGSNRVIILGLNDGNLYINAAKFNMNNHEAKSGKATFSDGTYLEFHNGVLTGGNTQGGSF